MKKVFISMVALMTAVLLTFCAACAPQNENGENTNKNISMTVVVPDGAPALAISKLINDEENFGIKTNYKVVAASDIKNFVVGSGEKADVALVPVNLASLLIGKGNEYKGVATVTHGNLYILSKDENQITAQNVNLLKGKSIGVVNLANVPGLTVKAMLDKAGIEFTMDEGEKTQENVYLFGINGSEIALTLNQAKADFVVAPEPAVSTITGKVPSIKKVAGLHDIYGSYPQAVMVVKAAFLEENKEIIKNLFDKMAEGENWIIENPTLAANAVASKLSEGATASFNAENTTENSVRGCGIKMINFSSEEIKNVEDYITAIKKFGGESPVANDFDKNFFVNIKG